MSSHKWPQGSSVGAASDTEAGTLSYYNYENITGDLDTSEGTYNLHIERIGRTVTISGVITVGGVDKGPYVDINANNVPAWAKPVVTVTNGFITTSAGYVVQVDATGLITLYGKDGDLAAVTNLPSGAHQVTMSYIGAAL